MLAALFCVWAINFFVVLPLVSPSFLDMVSYPASLMSKLLFGLAAAETFRLLDRSRLVASANDHAPALVRARKEI
jgi:hypothetical protein